MIAEMARANRTWGEARIAAELLRDRQIPRGHRVCWIAFTMNTTLKRSRAWFCGSVRPAKAGMFSGE
jgi:hypothetical protein